MPADVHACTVWAKGKGIKADNLWALCNDMKSKGTGYFASDASEAQREAEANSSATSLEARAFKGAYHSSREAFSMLPTLAHMEGVPDHDVIPGVVVISEGEGNKRQKHYYGAEAIASVVPLTNGAQAYLDHIGTQEAEDRPERTVRDLCGFYTNARLARVQDEYGRTVSACVADLVPADNEAGREVRALARQARLFHKLYPESREVFCGTSIDGDGAQAKRTLDPGDGTEREFNYVKEITVLNSADIVTRPARGGDFIQDLDRIMNAQTPEEAQQMVTEAQVKEVTTLAGLLESARKGGKPDEVKRLLKESRIKVSALAEAEGVEPPALPAPTAEELAAKAAEAAAVEARTKGKKNKAAEDEDEDDAPDEKGGKMSASEKETRRLLRESTLAVKSVTAELAGMKAREACTAMLAESKIPADILSVAELVAVPEAERPLWIRNAKKWTESAGRGFGGGNFPRGEVQDGAGSLKESIAGRLAARGITAAPAGR